MVGSLGLLVLGGIALVGEIMLGGLGHLSASMETTLTSVVTLAVGGHLGGKIAAAQAAPEVIPQAVASIPPQGSP